MTKQEKGLWGLAVFILKRKTDQSCKQCGVYVIVKVSLGG